jgi:deoxyribose-phosphate aldolase
MDSSNPTESQTLIQDFLAAHSALDAELDPIEVMTDRYTNQEWAAQIAETQKKVKIGAGKKYDVPRLGTPAFAQTIDHTVLKLDAKESQIDALCSEARTEGFKVCGCLLYSMCNRVVGREDAETLYKQSTKWLV